MLTTVSELQANGILAASQLDILMMFIGTVRRKDVLLIMSSTKGSEGDRCSTDVAAFSDYDSCVDSSSHVKL